MKENILQFNDVNLWFEPRRRLEKDGELVCEMSEEDHAFLCGMLDAVRPQKILEIGVAEGGTTAVIMNCLRLLDLKSNVYSVDLSERLYIDNSKKTGYIYDEMRHDIKGKSTHEFLFGKTIAGYIDSIGENIDFVIIDTTHILPGEILDFLCVLPYLNREATVVLHDISTEYQRCFSEDSEVVLRARESNATKILFTTVTAQKYFSVNSQCKTGYNIAAFTITDDSIKYIRDCFHALNMTWEYELTDEIVKEYRDIIIRYYNEECIKLFDIAVETNKIMQNRRRIARKDLFFDYMRQYSALSEEKINQLRQASQIIVYGAGVVAVEIIKILGKANIKIDAIAVSDEEKNVKRLCGIEVKNISKLLDYRDAAVIISSISDRFIQEIEKTLKEKEFHNIMKVDRII